jgi:hypothetical protein
MQNKLWRLAAGAMMVAGLAGCSTLTDTVSQTWNKTWSSLGGKSQAPAESKTAQAPARAGLQPSQESGRWQGMYSLEGESGRFQDCNSGQTIAVLAEGDSVLLEQAYLNTRSHASASMLAEVVGRVQECWPRWWAGCRSAPWPTRCWPARGARSWPCVWSVLSPCPARRIAPGLEPPWAAGADA